MSISYDRHQRDYNSSLPKKGETSHQGWARATTIRLSLNRGGQSLPRAGARHYDMALPEKGETIIAKGRCLPLRYFSPWTGRETIIAKGGRLPLRYLSPWKGEDNNRQGQALATTICLSLKRGRRSSLRAGEHHYNISLPENGETIVDKGRCAPLPNISPWEGGDYHQQGRARTTTICLFLKRGRKLSLGAGTRHNNFSLHEKGGRIVIEGGAEVFIPMPPWFFIRGGEWHEPKVHSKFCNHCYKLGMPDPRRDIRCVLT
jgi:hypothetical protein